MSKGKITIKDNSGAVKEAFKDNVLKALTECGLVAEGYAKLMCPVDTGNLRNSITTNVVMAEKACYVGTNVEYAPYVELGTYKQSAQPYLKPAIANYAETYKMIIERELKANATLT